MTRTRSEDDIFQGVIGGGDGGPNARCQWDETVCLDSPSHLIDFVVGDGPDDHEPVLFCARHYAVELARFVQLHPAECPYAIDTHIVAFGSIDRPRTPAEFLEGA